MNPGLPSPSPRVHVDAPHGAIRGVRWTDDEGNVRFAHGRKEMAEAMAVMNARRLRKAGKAPATTSKTTPPAARNAARTSPKPAGAAHPIPNLPSKPSGSTGALASLLADGPVLRVGNTIVTLVEAVAHFGTADVSKWSNYEILGDLAKPCENAPEVRDALIAHRAHSLTGAEKTKFMREHRSAIHRHLARLNNPFAKFSNHD